MISPLLHSCTHVPGSQMGSTRHTLNQNSDENTIESRLCGEKRSNEEADLKLNGDSQQGNSWNGKDLIKLPRELTDMFGPLECKLCKVVVDSPMIALTHYKGKFHLKKINAYMKENYNVTPLSKKPKISFSKTCEVCNVTLTSEIQADQHFSGKTHLKNLRKPPKSSNFISVPKVEEDKNGRFGIGVAFYKEEESNTDVQLIEPEFFCHLCNVSTTSADQLEAHKKGAKHIKKLKKDPMANNIGKESKDLSMYRTPSDLYYCPKCNLSTNSAEQFMQHTESKKHKKNFKLKDNLSKT